MVKIYISIFFLFLMVSCTEIDEAAVDGGRDYQPLKIGSYWEYEVSETVYFGEADSEIEVFFYRDHIRSDYFNEAGEQVFLLVREKSTDRQHWQRQETYTYRISRGTLIKGRDNQHVVSLVFPPMDGTVWDGNILNSGREENYRLLILPIYTVDATEYKHVAKVVHHEEDDLITLRDNRYEVFAKGVGLVESYYEVLSYCSRNDCLGQQIIDSGRRIHLKLIQYG